MLDPNGFTPIPLQGSAQDYKQAIVENRCRIADAQAPGVIRSTDHFFSYQASLFTLINLSMKAVAEHWPERDQISALERAYQERMYHYTTARFCHSAAI